MSRRSKDQRAKLGQKTRGMPFGLCEEQGACIAASGSSSSSTICHGVEVKLHWVRHAVQGLSYALRKTAAEFGPESPPNNEATFADRYVF